MAHKDDLPKGWGKQPGNSSAWGNPEIKNEQPVFRGWDYQAKSPAETPENDFPAQPPVNNNQQPVFRGWDSPEKPPAETSRNDFSAQQQSFNNNQSSIFQKENSSEKPPITDSYADLSQTRNANKKNPIIYMLPVLIVAVVIGNYVLDNNKDFLEKWLKRTLQGEVSFVETTKSTEKKDSGNAVDDFSKPSFESEAKQPEIQQPEITEQPSVQVIPVTEPPTNPPKISCEIKASASEMGEGYYYTLYVNGNYDYYYVNCMEYGYEDSDGYQVLSGNEYTASVYLTAASSLDHVTASVTPYYSDGTAGETVTCTIKQPEPQATNVPFPSDCFYMGTGTPVSSDGFLNLRSSKSTSSDSNIITQIPNGSVISMYYINDDNWIYVEYGSYSGYVKESCTKLTDAQGLWDDGNGGNEEVTVYSCYKTGAINGRGVSGFTTSYVVNGGSKTTVRDTLGDGWHITANSYCYAYGLTWYELYDTDDGDYYGWVDSNFISFY